MRYYIDTEFLEGTQKETFPISLFRKETKPTIDLISIGIVAEDGRQYYAISKDFNLKEAWNRYDKVINKQYHSGPEYNKIYWIRENVLKPIWNELILKELEIDILAELENPFTYRGLKYLLNKYGKTNKQIAEEIKEFIYNKEDVLYNHEDCKINHIGEVKSKIDFYSYYADYDWVAFCWLFGKMIDLPNGFPMYCIDLKQTLDEKQSQLKNIAINNNSKYYDIKEMRDYPKQTNEHNALSDAIWNKQLHEFLNTL